MAIVNEVEQIRNILTQTLTEFLFEIKNETLYSNVVTRFNQELSKLGNIYDYVVICDSNNNSSADNSLKVDIAVKFNEKAEFVYIPMKVNVA